MIASELRLTALPKQPPPATTPPIDRKDQLEVYVNDVVVRTVQQIAEDNEFREEHCSSDSKLLNGGIWYPNRYYQALVKCNQSSRIKWMIDGNKAMFGHPTSDFRGIPNQDPNLEGYPSIAQYKLKESSKPSAAIESIRKGPALLDCAIVCQIGFYQAIHSAIGTEKFDKLFSHSTGNPLILSDFNYDENPIKAFCDTPSLSASQKGHQTVTKGMRVAFANTTMYKAKHLVMGEGGAFNAICLDATPGKQTFLGLGLPSKGATEQEIEQDLVDEYNAAPLDLSSLHPDLASKVSYKGNEGYRARNAFFHPEGHAERNKYIRILTEMRIPRQIIDQQVAIYQSTPSCITLRDIEEDPEAGFRPETALLLDASLIQHIAQQPLDSISYTDIVNYRTCKERKRMGYPMIDPPKSMQEAFSS